MKRIYFWLLYFCSLGLTAQSADLYPGSSVSNALHQANIGRIVFTDGNIPLEQLRKVDFLKSFPLGYRSDLNIRVFMDNSVANYLHRLAPEIPADELLKMGNLQFTFYVDEKRVYQENIHHGCHFGSADSKKTFTTFRVPLTSTKGEDWWAMYLWERFKRNGGEKVLTNGKHLLKIEIRPYVKLNETDTKTGDLIAKGQVQLIIKPPKVTAHQVRIQPIAPGSGWEISDFDFDRKKIEQLNTEIAKFELKEITSVVVVHQGKLLLEEYFNGANRETLHDTRSATKSFTSALLGMAIADGYIKDENEPLGRFYDLKKFDHYSRQKDSITLKNLLTMGSAFDGSDSDDQSPGNEENMYPTENWVKFALDLPMDPNKTNGGQWDYFTAGVVMLGDVLDRSVPGGLEQYADRTLLKPLGIGTYQWQYTPQKVANTAGSLQMCALDFARYAQLYQNNGLWKGKQILPSDWVQKTLSQQIPIPGRTNEYYGYLFWNKTFTYGGRDYQAYYCSGNGGNHFVVFKNLPIVAIITAKAYNKPYAHPQADRIVQDYLLPAILK